MVEGETQQDDPYFYTQWFGDLATQLSFFAQNGWQQVERSVQELRSRLTGRPVYGIIDRDLSPATVIDAQFREEPADGIFRTECYTLENYLFEPACWHRVIRALHRGAPPEGWSNESEIAQRIEACPSSKVTAGGSTVSTCWRTSGCRACPSALPSITSTW